MRSEADALRQRLAAQQTSLQAEEDARRLHAEVQGLRQELEARQRVRGSRHPGRGLGWCSWFFYWSFFFTVFFTKFVCLCNLCSHR